jgi:hypothetical protein
MFAERGVGPLSSVLAAVERPLSIDPGLRPGAASPAFRRAGRVHIPQFLTKDSADRVHAGLAAETLWWLSTLGGGQTIDVPVEQVGALPPDARARMIALAHDEARSGFHYMFETLRLDEMLRRGEPLHPGLAAACRFLTSRTFLDFVAGVTGDHEPDLVDARATRFQPGHYLTQHDDAKPSAGRRYAYVLNLTPRWRVDWGGLLNFIDDDGHVAEAYTPAWNALNLFRVPCTHSVSMVAPFAGAPRLSITGWVRVAAPPS